jgi:hypothetical protein
MAEWAEITWSTSDKNFGWPGPPGPCSAAHAALLTPPSPRSTSHARAMAARVAMFLLPSPASSESSALLASRPSPPLLPQVWAQSLHIKWEVDEEEGGEGG